MKKKESDQEFLNRIMKLKEDSTKHLNYTAEFKEEYEKGKNEGKKVGKVLEELEMCKKIKEEFKLDPPIQKMIHINGMLAYIDYDAKHIDRINLLKKRTIGFNCATDDESYFAPQFTTIGSVNIKRGSLNIPLPKDSKLLPIIIKDGDIIETAKDSYLTSLTDNEANAEDEVRLVMYPNSKVKVKVTENTKTVEPTYIDPSRVSDIIKKKSKSTLHTTKIKNIELLTGLFQVTVNKSKTGRNANNYVTIENIEFGPSTKTYAGMFDDVINKAYKQNPAIAKMIETNLSKQKERFNENKICTEITAYVELNSTETVIFGSLNNIIVKGNPINVKSNLNPKYTIRKTGIFVTDCNKNPDPRVKAVAMGGSSIFSYAAIAESDLSSSSEEKGIKNAEEALDLAKKINDKMLIMVASRNLKNAENENERVKSYLKTLSPKGLKARKKEAEEALEAAKEIGDKELIEVAEEQVKNAGVREESFSPQVLEHNKKMIEKMTSEFLRIKKEGLPPYNNPSMTDRVI